MTDNPAEILLSLNRLRQRARHDRDSYALPLLVFATLPALVQSKRAAR